MERFHYLLCRGNYLLHEPSPELRQASSSAFQLRQSFNSTLYNCSVTMAEDNNSDRLFSEPPDFLGQHNRTGSMSLGDEHESEPMNGDMTTAPPAPVQVDLNTKDVHDVVNSELGVSTLLNRLKQSIASAKVGFPSQPPSFSALTQAGRNSPSS